MADIEITKDERQRWGDEFKAAIIRGLVAVGEDCADIASQNAPFDTGWLSEHISYALTDDDMSVIIGTNVEYAPYQELGTSTGYKGWNGGKGFLRPAATENAERYRAIMKKHLENA